MKTRLLFFTVCLLFVFSSCSSKTKENARVQNDAASVSPAQINPMITDNNPEPKDNMAIQADENSDVDLDLTNKSATIVYSQVFNMLVEPEEYEGKKIRYKGLVAVPDDFPEGYFVPGRLAMTCCAEDIALVGFPCEYAQQSGVKEGTWIEVTATVHAIMNRQTNEPSPVMIAESIESTDAPEDEVAYFY